MCVYLKGVLKVEGVNNVIAMATLTDETFLGAELRQGRREREREREGGREWPEEGNGEREGRDIE